MSQPLATLGKEESSQAVAGRAHPNSEAGKFRKRWRPVRRSRSIGFLVGSTALVFAMAIWQLASGFIQPRLLPSPVATFDSIITGPVGSLEGAVGSSMLDLFVGFASAAIIGIAFGMLMGRVRWLGNALSPLLSLAIATPTVALLPLLIIWLGLGRTSRVVFIVLVSVWGMTINTYLGSQVVNRSASELVKVLRLSKIKAATAIYWPATLPYIFVGLRVTLAHALVATIISGQEVGTSGVGGLAEEYAGYFQTDRVLGVIICVVIIAVVLYHLLKVLQRRMCPWIPVAVMSAQKRPIQRNL